MELSWPTSEFGRKGEERDEEEIISMPFYGTAADRGSPLSPPLVRAMLQLQLQLATPSTLPSKPPWDE
jgi:hypothetical protein